MNEKMTHINQKGEAIMVDVSQKAETERLAVAKGTITMNQSAMEAVKNGTVKKGDALATARIAGIMAAKKTSDIIPLCHPLSMSGCEIEFIIKEESLCIEALCSVKIYGKTGVEMEALMGVSAALLTIYDMCKALDKGMIISDIRLLKKEGGKSGTYIAKS